MFNLKKVTRFSNFPLLMGCLMIAIHLGGMLGVAVDTLLSGVNTALHVLLGL
jgi:hypothetical protein